MKTHSSDNLFYSVVQWYYEDLIIDELNIFDICDWTLMVSGETVSLTDNQQIDIDNSQTDGWQVALQFTELIVNSESCPFNVITHDLIWTRNLAMVVQVVSTETWSYVTMSIFILKYFLHCRVLCAVHW